MSLWDKVPPWLAGIVWLGLAAVAARDLRRRAGPTVLRLPLLRTGLRVLLAIVGVLVVGCAAAGLASDPPHLRDLTEGAGPVLFLFGTLAFLSVQTRLAITEAGMVLYGEFVSWDRIRSWEWLRGGYCRVHFADAWENRLTGKLGRTFRVPPNLKEAVDALLAEHMPQPQQAASSP